VLSIPLVLWLVKRLSQLPAGRANGLMSIAATLSVGPREQIAVVKVGERAMLVGITSQSIQLLTEGGPFPAGEYTRGGTDILISMIYRIAFGRSGSDFGFASAVSVILFAVTGVLAALQFRATKKLEDVN